jgi:N12 class adenine-specific DNA methylase
MADDKPTYTKYRSRPKLFSRIATGDYDAIILPQSQFNRVQDDPQRVASYMQEQISLLTEQKEARSRQRGKRDPSVKDMERAIKKLRESLDKLLSRETDNVRTFDQLGVDGLLVDEAHEYKKLQFSTTMDNIKGLDRGFSQRGLGFFMKARYVQDRTGGKNVVPLTGTPVTNTLAEAWTMMRYVRPDLLKANGIEHFDEFASTFTRPVTKLNMNAVGEWKVETRLAQFQNVQELVRLW